MQAVSGVRMMQVDNDETNFLKVSTMISRIVTCGAVTAVLSLCSFVVEVPAAEAGPAVDVPNSIPADLSRDVTDELNRYFAKLPEGVSVRFPAGAKYRIDGTVLLEDCRNITVDGNGAVFRAFEPGEDHGKKENYSGWKKTRNRAHFRIAGGRNIVVRNVEVHGAHPDAGKGGTYDYNREAQHGFDVVGAENCTLEKLTVHDVYGDCVYVTKSRGVIVRDSKLTRCGRQGIAVATGEDVLIENNEIADSRRGIIDIEPYGKEWRTGNIRIIGNRLGGSRLLLLPMGGSGTVGMVFVADNVNTEQNGTPAVMNKGQADQNRGPYVMINNRLTIGGSPASGLRIRHNDGIFLAGNTLTFPEKRHMTALELDGSRGAVVANRFVGAAEVGGESPEITRLANATTEAGASSETEWKRIPGGFAVRVTLSEGGEVVALMRGGPAMESPPEQLSGYGQSTAAEFAWFHLEDGKVIDGGTRKSSEPRDQDGDE